MPRRQSIQRIQGYGARLRDRLAASTISQVELANATGLSRQTVVRALADFVSPRTARLIDDAIPKRATLSASTTADASGAPSPSLATAARPRSDAWATATDIHQWSDRRDAQEDLPRLLRRLVLVSHSGVRRISFRSGEGVQVPGIDGRVETDEGSAFVPEGVSVWEMGAGGNPASKAQEDYAKRTADPRDVTPSTSTFVFVTSRRWRERDSWVAARKAEQRWKDVRVLDADDLETWLEGTPSVHLWLSRRIGVFPDGAADLEHWWANWLDGTRPALTAEFVLAGRDEALREIQQWKVNPCDPIAVRSESRNESIAVIASTFLRFGDDDRDKVFARTVIVETESAWRHLVASKLSLILIPTFDADSVIASATRAGHAVVIPLGESDVRRSGVITVPPIARDPAVAALEPNRDVRRDRAYALASLARRSMAALRRRLATAPTMQVPEWGRPAAARTVIPALLAGGWSQDFPGDRRALDELAQVPYGEVAERLLPWTHGTDPVLRRRAAVWYLVSREDAWDLLARYVTGDDVDRFLHVAIDVLSTPDPRLELPAEERWLAGITGPTPEHSGHLHDALASTIAVMGTRLQADESGAAEFGGVYAGVSFGDVARRAVKELLEKANANWRVWASLSLSQCLPALAEGAPDEFLDALDAGLRYPASPVGRIFDSEGDGFFSSSPHPGLLWALERLAWSRDYLGRVVQLLGRLWKQDPGGKLANRPSASLKAIFLPWCPQTAATPEQRLAVLDTWSCEEPALAWEVIISMLPQLHGVGSFSPKPRWRNWAPDEETKVSNADYALCIRFAVAKLLELVGEDGGRWKALLEAVPRLPASEHNAVLEKLGGIDPQRLPEANRDTIWDAIRTLVADHRSFKDAQWAMPIEQVERIDALRERFAPADPGQRYAWLFAYRPHLPDATTSIHDFSAYEDELTARRIAVVSEVARTSGLEGLLQIVALADEPQFVGSATAAAGVFATAEDAILERYLADADQRRSVFAHGYAFERARTEGRVWMETKFRGVSVNWTPEKRAQLLLAVESDRQVWQMAAAAGEAVERAYWTRQPLYFIRNDADVEDGARKLLAFGRPYAAVDLLGMHVEKAAFDPQLVTEVLESCLSTAPSNDGHRSLFTHNVGRLLDYLADQSAIDEIRVGRLEWGFLPVISRYERVPEVLHRALAREPALFVEIVSLLYRSKSEPKRDEDAATEEDRQKASRAFSLLRDWRRLPGTREDGTVNGVALKSWVEAARSELNAKGRAQVGDQEIGQLLSASPSDPDGTWPCAPVRDLIETIASDDLDQGLSIGLYNSRGVTWRNPADGGVQERGLAERYAGLAAAATDRWPRTGAVLRRIAEGYRGEAQREDHGAALEEDLGR